MEPQNVLNKWETKQSNIEVSNPKVDRQAIHQYKGLIFRLKPKKLMKINCCR